MEPHQKRVVDERAELDLRRDNLAKFMTTDVFWSLDRAESDRLRTQHSVMGVYSDILSQRIAAFTDQ
jgi:hypothetical protein